MSNNGSASTVDQTACCSTDTTLELIGISFSVFVVFYVIIHYVRQLLLRWRQQPEGGDGARARRMLGLDPATIAALPSSTYRKAKNASDGECAVCLSALEEGETVRTLPTCEHTFHRACIDVWLRKHITCPVCRADAESGKATVVEEGSRRQPSPPPEIGGGGGETSGISKAELGSSSALQPMWSGRSRDCNYFI